MMNNYVSCCPSSTSLTFRMRSFACYLVSCFILSSFLNDGAFACWGITAPKFGDMSPDYDLAAGSDLVLNCTLNNLTFPEFPRPVNSSDLVISKGDQEFTDFTRVINEKTIQLHIPNATPEDSGIYFCKIVLSENNKPLVCGSKVNVGYPPFPVFNFTCITRNFNNLKCFWDIQENKVLTEYTITKSISIIVDRQQMCPNSTRKRNSCEWNQKTDPVYRSYQRNVTFTITGNNSLGTSTDTFTLDTYALLIPNSPEDFKILQLGNQFVSVSWKQPDMRNAFEAPPLIYQIWLSKVLHSSENSSDVLVFDIGKDTSNFSINGLIPHILYNVSVRCRSSFAENENMWSDFASLVFETLSDVPYMIPEVTPEAYELHMYEDFRSAGLYWKGLPKMYHNGENFHYHIKYNENIISGAPKIYTINTSNPFVNIKNLLKNTSYSFHIYSANEIGISKDYGSIIIKSQNEILPAPRDVRVISQDTGYYNLSWYPPNDEDNFNYIVFWCSSLKPWITRCDGSIKWINGSLNDTNIVLNLSDMKTNFQFAVVAKSEDRSSGMQWASCIVPHKGVLSKINYVVVEQKNSSALKVIWNLDCPAEKALVKRYDITVCRIQTADCHVVEAESNADNFLLENLHPYSNYSVKIRTINNNNKASEDSDAVYQSTSPGAPAGPPENVHVSSNSKDSFLAIWTPPSQPNGIITQYIVSYNGSKQQKNVDTAQTEYSFKVSGLQPYTTYAVQIQACVGRDCSVKSQPVEVQTEVDEPGFMEPPRIEEVNSTHFKVSWTAPLQPNGPIDYYIVKWHEERQNASSSDSDNTLEVFGVNSVILDVKCSSLGDEAKKYFFYVRAVNKKNAVNLFGPFSESTQAKACLMPEGLGMFIGTIVGAAFGAALILVIIYRFALWMRFKIHQVKSITIRLPEGLEGPETNPLNNYEYFKSGLNGNIQSNNTERLSYIIDESKNRHGSGSSQFSNSSAEELIFKNGKCAKFGRKPSGDSSGCSSMSSGATPRMHLSSDSGTESDFAIPPSPDSALTESSLHNSHKTPLPILMEVHDQPILEKALNEKIGSPDKKCQKNKIVADDVILKVDPPYSKFGYAGNSSASVPWRVNPLAFYSCNLANSEPSVFDTQKAEKNEVNMAPYSKVGLAKSSGDVSSSAVKQMGYSKFGFSTPQNRFSVPPANLNPIAMVVLENPDKKEWPDVKKNLNDYYSQSKKSSNKNVSSSNDFVEDCGYVKVGKGKICLEKKNHGYVSFNDLRSQMNCGGNSPVLGNSEDKMKNMDCNSLNEKDQVEFPDDSEWPSFNNYDSENKMEDTAEVLFDVPLSPHSTPLGGEAIISSSYDFTLPECHNTDESLPKVLSESEVKYNSDSPTLSFSEVNIDTNPFSQNHVGPMLHSDNILCPSTISVAEESQSGETARGRTNTYGIPNEVIVTPMTLKNNYVPFNALSDSLCDRAVITLPNVPKSNVSQTVLPNGVCTEADNYISPSHNRDLRLLRENSLPKSISIVSSSHRDSLNSGKCSPSRNGYSNLSLKYILKSLPKMESEVCEV